ncbi:unnamed protein product [Blepharisma stoltei]|uniref:SKP1 component POZ domain-containing protein n=1 Tax=Blepharisma stoltei TaxID=1481888 RepID=A0AAU9JN77_9CILI|nr:unnamed protein product [Blepharisma stoltei]
MMENHSDLENIKILSWDGDLFTIPIIILNYSEVLQQMPNLEHEISLEHLEIDTTTLSKIIEFCKFHDFISPEQIDFPLKTRNLDEIILKDFDRAFFKSLSEEDLLKLALAAHKLEIIVLMKLCCIAIASSYVNLSGSEFDSLTEFIKLGIEEDEWLRVCEFPFAMDAKTNN